MEVATFVYKRLLASQGLRRKIWSAARTILIKIMNDPACSLRVHARSMSLPLSHPLPMYYDEHRYYDRLPQRLGQYLRQKYGFIKCIDVGANIGDSVASFYPNDADSFLAIEPNPNFHAFLIANWHGSENITVLSVICSSDSSTEGFTILEKNGTASITRTEDGAAMTRRPLDAIANDIPAFKDANVIKIDTDGHDFEVIAGAANLISRHKPAVLFECDVFANANYVEDCLQTLKFFAHSGYHHFLLYDNVGSLLGKYSLFDLSAFKSLLFYQLTSEFKYFDILVMKDDDIFPFFASEILSFTEMKQNTTCRQARRLLDASITGEAEYRRVRLSRGSQEERSIS